MMCLMIISNRLSREIGLLFRSAVKFLFHGYLLLFHYFFDALAKYHLDQQNCSKLLLMHCPGKLSYRRSRFPANANVWHGMDEVHPWYCFGFVQEFLGLFQMLNYRINWMI